MADNYIEHHQDEYERRKQAWIQKKKHLIKGQCMINKPEDEAL